MEENQNFVERLESSILKKKEWFDSSQLPAVIEQYRLMLVCVKTINENLVKRSIVTPDPYKWDKRISEVVVPPADSFNEQDFSQVLGERLSTYETMLDFVCNYYRFSIESLPVQKVKLLVEKGDDKELVEYPVSELKFKPKRHKVSVTAEEIKELASLEDKEGSSKLQ